MESWQYSVARAMLEWRGDRPGWGYQRESEPSVEPTALCSLALLVGPIVEPKNGISAPAQSSANWLTWLQRADGSVGLSARIPTPAWPTALAVLLWRALGAYDASCRRAVAFLLEHRGLEYEKGSDDPVGHNTELVGWPWVGGTHSWLEPTCWAILALTRAGAGDSARVREGVELLLDRAVPSGGWNYGNSSAFGAALRPQLATTGLALMTLAGRLDKEPKVDRAVAYLERELFAVRTVLSLSWGLLGLCAWGRNLDGAESWLQEAWALARRRRPSSVQLACLLLAANRNRALEVLGIRSTRATAAP
jgi:hypothetical protein